MFTRSQRTPRRPSELQQPYSASTLTQARLDRTVHYPKPTGAFQRSFLRWYVRLTNNSTDYSDPELKGRRLELGSQIAALKRTVENPLEEMPASEWLAAAERLERLEGQAKAIEAVQDSRAKSVPREPPERARTWGARAPTTSAVSFSPPSSTADTAESDPFAAE